MRWLVAALIRRELRRTFRRVVWIGPPPLLPPGPVVAVANHQSFHDGHLLWLLALDLLDRPFVVWMEECDRVPFFALQGALPFPPTDAARRASSIRRTRRVFADRPHTLLAYFPEGELHGADEPLRPFGRETLNRLHHVLGKPAWWPVAVHLTWRGDSRPTALLSGGTASPAPRGTESQEIEDQCARLRETSDGGTILLEGRDRRHERWDLRWARPAFRHHPGGK